MAHTERAVEIFNRIYEIDCAVADIEKVTKQLEVVYEGKPLTAGIKAAWNELTDEQTKLMAEHTALWLEAGQLGKEMDHETMELVRQNVD